ncbi:MAG: hypothetical protein EXR99_04220 [Gemmataceae bacterium]|nr:hypothetical protein [Gemmataceae bacterium]
MNRLLFTFFLGAFLGLVSFSLPGIGQEKGKKGFLSVLKEGQKVVLRESAGQYEITLIEGGSKVIEVGQDFVVIGDLVGARETRIPIYSLKNIIRIKGAP